MYSGIIIDLVLLAIALAAFACIFITCAEAKWESEMRKVDTYINSLDIEV